MVQLNAGPLRRFRQYIRFSLRSFLVVSSALAVTLGLHLRSSGTQKSAIEGIRKQGGRVRYDFQYPSGLYGDEHFDSQAESIVPDRLLESFGIDFFHSVVFVSMAYTDDNGQRVNNSNYSDAAMEFIGQLPQLRVLHLSNTQATDKSLEHLKCLTNLENLFFWNATQVGDEGVSCLSRNKRLRYIHIDGANLTDRSMRVFASFSHLEGLSAQGNHFSNRALELIKESKQLKKLFVGLGDGGIDDAGMRHVSEMKNLEKLGLQGCPLTDCGIRELSTLANLRVLFVGGRDSTSGPAITDRSAQLLSSLELEKLCINRARISNTGIAKLTSIRELQFLRIGSVQLEFSNSTANPSGRTQSFCRRSDSRPWYVYDND